MGERKTVIKILYFLLKKFEHCPGAIVSIVMYFVLVTLIRFRRPLTFARTMQTRKGYNLSILLVQCINQVAAFSFARSLHRQFNAD